ncbi:MAG TPA: M48 family metalloprotease [Candidatus Levybacteria bacterium]|nr:M48 family metalloprotease [Candidatus Levybacteria bacterium]
METQIQEPQKAIDKKHSRSHQKTQSINAHREIVQKIFQRDKIDNESDPSKTPILKPQIEQQDHDGHAHGGLEEDFEYLSRTHDLEINTPKTEHLTHIVNRLMDNSDLKTRIVVMNKGKDPNAFVFQEGTIFVSQSLLNSLDSEDEIASVLAHELGHLINETSRHAHSHDNRTTQMAVGRLHEMTADNKDAPKLLEKGGYNTLAFGTAIEKISGVHGGTLHQGGLARASENVGIHLVRDYETSNNNLTPKSKLLDGVARKTNMEIINELTYWNTQNSKKLLEALPKLHHKDLLTTTISVLRNSRGYDLENKYMRFQLENVKCVEKYITQTLAHSGFTPIDAEISLFILHSQFVYENAPFTTINNPQELVSIAERLAKYEAEGQGSKMLDILFHNPPEEHFRDSSAPIDFLQVLTREMYDQDSGIIKGTSIPITEDALLKVLKTVQEQNNQCGKLLGNSILRFAELKYITSTNSEKKTLQEVEVETFLRKAKDMGIIPTKSNFPLENLNTTHDSINPKIRLKEIFNNVFFEEKQTPDKLTTELIDSTFKKIEKTSLQMDTREIGNIVDVLNLFSENFSIHHATDEERLTIANYINEKIDALTLGSEFAIRATISGEKHKTNQTVDESNENGDFLKFQIKLATASTLFPNDSEQFYTFLNSTISTHQQFLSTLSPTETKTLFNSVINLRRDNRIPEFGFYLGDIYQVQIKNPVNISNFTQFSHLKPVQEIAINMPPIPASNLNELARYKKTQYEIDRLTASYNEFSDTIGGVLYERQTRIAIEKILSGNISEKDFSALGEFIEDTLPNGSEKGMFLRVLDKRTLNSRELSLDEKTRYALENFERIGPEGLFIIANQMDSIDDYSKFRSMIEDNFDKYLAGTSPGLVKAASADLISSKASFKFAELFATAQGGNKATEISTKYAKGWAHTFIPASEYHEKEIGVKFDIQTGRFAFSESGRERFKTFSEYVKTLQTRSEPERLALAHKALVEEYGAFAKPENRQILADILISSLGVKDGFLESSIRTAITEGDAKIMAFPGAKMMAPLLFKGLDSNRVDFLQVVNENFQYHSETKTYTTFKDELSEQAIVGLNKAIHGKTSDVSEFGVLYQDHPDSLMFKLAQESEQQYRFTIERIKQILDIKEEGAEIDNLEAKVDPAIESIVGAVEASGAVGVRALQLLTQLYPLSPEIRERLSSSFDKNPGLNKFWMWDNVWKMAESNPEVAEVLKGATVHEIIGAGSLNTTIAATLTTDEGNREVVIKLLNPNAAALIGESHKLAHDTLEKVGEKGKFKKEVQAGLLVVDLAQKWCLADIGDATFLDDDAAFATNITGVNKQIGTDIFYAPETIKNGYKFKVEERATGRTLNQLLNDTSVPIDNKREVIDSVLKLYAYQMQNPALQNSNSRFLLQSDPHVGNFVVDEETQKIGVIDRNMYLSASQADIDVISNLIRDGDYESFTKAFLGRVFEHNHCNIIERTRVLASMLSVKNEYAKQVTSGNIDRIGLLRSIMEKVAAKNLEVPLSLQLMVRNTEAMKKLANDYGLSIADYFQ